MDIVEFEYLLKKAALSKKAFADLVEMNSNSVTNWNKTGIPGWVKSWILLYIENEKYMKIKELIKDDI